MLTAATYPGGADARDTCRDDVTDVLRQKQEISATPWSLVTRGAPLGVMRSQYHQWIASIAARKGDGTQAVERLQQQLKRWIMCDNIQKAAELLFWRSME
jgi:hypothetical protein